MVSQYPSCTPADKCQKVTVTQYKTAFRTQSYSWRPPGLTPSPGTFGLFLTHLLPTLPINCVTVSLVGQSRPYVDVLNLWTPEH